MAFNGICLTDTFQLYESEQNLLTPQLPVNSERLKKQKSLDIKVIISNPPYSAGQQSGNDNNQNVKYKKLDKSIQGSYAKNSMTANKNSLYDSYIRAIRWASDRIGDPGVIGFITNASWLESNASDGMRKCLKEEFSSIYIFHLRGNQRTSGERSRQEGGKIFGGGSRAPIAISILVKNPKANSQGNIHFHDIGDYLNRAEKLKAIANFGSIAGIREQNKWQAIQPDKHHDWLNQRDDSFYTHIPMGDKRDKTKSSIFENYSIGIGTSRDAWVYNASKQKLERNVKGMIDFYNQEYERYQQSDKKTPIKDFVNNDPRKISWSSSLLPKIQSNVKGTYNQNGFNIALYRPFNKQCFYFNEMLNHRVAQMPKIFPEAGLDNLVIGVSGKGANSFSVLISNILADLHLLDSQSQCFPLKLYEPVEADDKKAQPETGIDEPISKMVTAPSGKQYMVTDGISAVGLQHFTDYYQDTSIGKEELFFYIYGLLHSPDYRQRFANTLSRDLPHIPRVKDRVDFAAFSVAGSKLADLHLHYEDKASHLVNFAQGNMTVDVLDDQDFYVKKMKFKTKGDKSAIIYNHNITITDIPLEAYEYIVNGKSAIEWVMERQGVATHKDSQIINNANDWAIETMHNPKYPLELLLKVITISLESVQIIRSLPKLVYSDVSWNYLVDNEKEIYFRKELVCMVAWCKRW